MQIGLALPKFLIVPWRWYSLGSTSYGLTPPCCLLRWVCDPAEAYSDLWYRADSTVSSGVLLSPALSSGLLLTPTLSGGVQLTLCDPADTQSDSWCAADFCIVLGCRAVSHKYLVVLSYSHTVWRCTTYSVILLITHCLVVPFWLPVCNCSSSLTHTLSTGVLLIHCDCADSHKV